MRHTEILGRDSLGEIDWEGRSRLRKSELVVQNRESSQATLVGRDFKGKEQVGVRVSE